MLTHLAQNSVKWPSAVNVTIKPSGSVKFGGIFWVAQSLVGSLPGTELILQRVNLKQGMRLCLCYRLLCLEVP